MNNYSCPRCGYPLDYAFAQQMSLQAQYTQAVMCGQRESPIAVQARMCRELGSIPTIHLLLDLDIMAI